MTDLALRLTDIEQVLARRQMERAYALTRSEHAVMLAEQSDAEVRAADIALQLLHHVRDTVTANVAAAISDLCSAALRLVFDDDSLRLEARSVERRGVIECDLMLVKGGMELSPLDSSGGGATAVISALLRLVLVRLLSRRGLLPLLVLDEPLAALSAGYREQMATVLREVAADLGVQCIVVTHEQELAAQGDTWIVRWADRDAVRAEVVRNE